MLTTPVEIHAYSPQKMHMHSCMRAYATVHNTYLPRKLLRTYLQSCASIVQAVVCRPPCLLSRRNQSPDAVLSRNPSKSTIAHDAVAAVVSYKHRSIIRVGAGLILFLYGSHSRLAAGLASSKILFSPSFRASFFEEILPLVPYLYSIMSQGDGEVRRRND